MTNPTLNGDTPTAASWWEEDITRREAQARGLGISALLLTSGLATGCDSEDQDARALQKQHGWNVGSTDKPLTQSGAQGEDSLGEESWSSYLEPKALMEVTRPSEPWRPFESPTLFQALSQVSLATSIKPVFTKEMKRAYDRGLSLASLIHASEHPEQVLFVLDMPGAMSVALAAGMAELVEPVFFFDNWPHPQGVVGSYQTLGSVLYYANEFKEKAEQRASEEALPRAIVLDSNRLAPYTSEGAKFDNRYVASLPDAKALKALGVTHVLYVTELTRSPNQELDDLNEPITALSEGGVKVASIGLDAFGKDPDAPNEDERHTRGYYYGGRYRSHGYFFVWYSSYSRSPSTRYAGWPKNPTEPRKAFGARKPTYKPALRSTQFSGRTFGSRFGVGRTKPTGFGKVSVSKDSSGRVRLGRSGRSGGSGRSGRSGSFGRSRGGGVG